ncbi:MAG: maleylacetate reductase [Chloroflexi bacterium]|nr:maleylacetate reductase [Chloroflexota bacterium]
MLTEFHYNTFPQEIIFGAGKLERLGEIVAQYHWSRALVVTTRSQRANGNLARVENALGAKLVANYDATQPHVPQKNVDDATRLAREHNADVLVALGGGSAIGVAKATSYRLQSPIPILAIPTTYAGSEVTPVFGVTRERDGMSGTKRLLRKETVNDPRVAPRVVLYDPQCTLDLPRELTAATGINAFAHCVEAAYSITRNPLSSAAAWYGARRIYHALPRCVENGTDVAARTEMLQGAYLAGVSLSNVAMGLHHGVCHVLGGTLNVPHGLANAIVLPHAIRFNADVCAEQLAQLARVLGIEAEGDEIAAQELAKRVAQWTHQMQLPSRLREVGVRETDLDLVAQLAGQSKMVQNNPKKISDGELRKFLAEIW